MLGLLFLVVGAVVQPGDPPPRPDPPTGMAAPDIRGFRPSHDGFRFVNSFTGSPFPISLGRLEQAAGVPQGFGLCGGMSFAAADLYLARHPAPEVADPPKRGSSLFAYLKRRQAESFGPGYSEPARFGRWMSAADAGSDGVRAMTLPELARVLVELDAGRPAVLGLVHTRYPANGRAAGPVGALWENHQVLAYGHHHDGRGAVSIRVYDPNFPGDDGARVVCAFTLEALAWTCAGGTPVPVVSLGVRSALASSRARPKPVRGFFAMPYSPGTPPADLR